MCAKLGEGNLKPSFQTFMSYLDGGKHNFQFRDIISLKGIWSFSANTQCSLLLIVDEIFAFIIEYFYIQVGKNKIEVLTGDEQNGMCHGLVQIILTSQDNFSDKASSLWKVIRETSDRQQGNVIYLFICYIYISICIQALLKICNS